MYLQKKKNKLYCKTSCACSFDNDAFCKNQEINDKRIVATSDVEA